MPDRDPMLQLIEQAYGQWTELHARGVTADVRVEGEVDGLLVTIGATTQPRDDGAAACVMTATRERLVAGVVPLEESTNAWVDDAPDGFRLAVADLRFDEDDRDIIEFALEDEEDPANIRALQERLDFLDGGHRVTPPPPESDDARQLADGLARAILAGVADGGIDAPFVIDHRLGDGRSALPGWVRAGSAGFRDSMRAANSTDGAAYDWLFRGRGDSGVALFDLDGLCDAETRRLAAKANTDRSFRPMDGGDAATGEQGLADEAIAGLIRRLNAPGAVPGADPSFLMVSSPREGVDGQARLRDTARVVGPEPVAAFEASIASRVPADAAAGSATGSGDHEGLAQRFAARGFPHADTLVRDLAEPAFRLVAAPEGARPAAIFHGRGLLPPGEPWPHTERGHALAFVAAVDLAELRAVGEPPVLPEEGWMLFFVDLDDPTGYDPERWNEPQPTPEGWVQGEFDGGAVPNGEGSDMRMFFVPPGTEPVPADPPGLRGTLPVAEQRRVAARQLTLPDEFHGGEELGFSPALATAYDEIAGALRRTIDGERTWDDDWVLGAVTGVQGNPPEPNTVLLLHLASVAFADGGAIQFRIPADALAERDWSQVVAFGDSN